mgnify:CR=1 FL=1
MNQAATIQQLTDRLRRIEAEIIAVREELKTLPEKQGQPTSKGTTVPYTWVDKVVLKKQMRHLFHTLSVQGEPVGAEMLQKQMGETELTSNELSQSIIAAREE